MRVSSPLLNHRLKLRSVQCRCLYLRFDLQHLHSPLSLITFTYTSLHLQNIINLKIQSISVQYTYTLQAEYWHQISGISLGLLSAGGQAPTPSSSAPTQSPQPIKTVYRIFICSSLSFLLHLFERLTPAIQSLTGCQLVQNTCCPPASPLLTLFFFPSISWSHHIFFTCSFRFHSTLIAVFDWSWTSLLCCSVFCIRICTYLCLHYLLVITHTHLSSVGIAKCLAKKRRSGLLL